MRCSTLIHLTAGLIMRFLQNNYLQRSLRCLAGGDLGPLCFTDGEYVLTLAEDWVSTRWEIAYGPVVAGGTATLTPRARRVRT